MACARLNPIYQGAGVDEFRRGGIHAALFAGVPIVPVCLYGTLEAMKRGIASEA